MKPRWIPAACLLAAALAASGCDPIGRGRVTEAVPESQVARTMHPTHNVVWTRALGPAANGDFHAVAIADFDGDGLPDLAGGGADRRGIRLWLANGDGTWSGVDGPQYLGLPAGLASADIDADGRTDIVVAGRGDMPGVRVWLNADELVWKEGEPATITHSYAAVKLVDLNSDGYPDVVAARERGDVSAGTSKAGGIAVWLNREGRGWSGDIGPRATETYTDIAVADFDGDGHVDIVGSRWGNPGGLDIWYGNSRGAWTRSLEDPAIKLNYQGVDVGDFNGDGATDIVATSYQSDLGVCVLLNDREGGWWTTPAQLAGKGSFWDAKAADLNDDGLLDVAVTSFDGRGVRVWLQLPREKDAVLPEFIEQSFRFPHKGVYYVVDTADFNSDDKPDLVVGSADEGIKAWFQTDELGVFTISPLTRPLSVEDELPRPFGEVDEFTQDPLQNKVYTTITRDDGLEYTEYRIGVGDILKVEIYPGRVADPIVVTKAVDASGELLLPVVSREPLRIVDESGGGVSPSQLRDTIREELTSTFRAPSVAVTVERYGSRQASILGEIRIKVNQVDTGPGQYTLSGKTRVLDFIARHGGFTDRADLTRVEIRNRHGEKRVVDLFKAIFQSKLSQDIVLDDGDVITIPSTAMSDRKVYVLGEVSKPGVYALTDNISLIEAVQLADSFTVRANRKQVVIIRGDKEKPDLFQINVLEILKTGDLSKNMLLENGDVVFVPKDWIGNLGEFYSWFLPSYRLFRP